MNSITMLFPSSWYSIPMRSTGSSAQRRLPKITPVRTSIGIPWQNGVAKGCDGE